MKKENNNIKLIKLFIKEENIKLAKGDMSFWGRESKIAKYLLSLYSEIEFWQTISINFKLNSLAYFRTEDGEKFLSLKYNLYKTELKTNDLGYELFGEKFGEDVEIKKNKNSSVKNFLT